MKSQWVFAYLSEGKFREELLGLVGLSKHELRVGLDAGTGVLGSDQSLVGPEVIRVGVKSLQIIIFLHVRICCYILSCIVDEILRL